MNATRVLATAFGLLMVAAVALQADAPGLIVAVAAAVAVLVSVQFPRAATLAVVACVVAVALSDASPIVTALAGLNAACYLLLRHTAGRGALTWATMVALSGSSAIGLVATAIPAELPWVPLAAPLAVLALFALAVQPLLPTRRLADVR